MKFLLGIYLSDYKKIWSYIPISRRLHLFGLFCLMVLSASVEVLSLGAVIPFLGAITNADSFKGNNIYVPIMQFFDVTEGHQLLWLITSCFVVAIIISTIIRVVFIWLNTKLSYDIGAQLGIEMFEKTLYQPYIKHAQRNSSEVMSGILTKAGSIVSGFLYPIINIASSFMMVLAILTVMFWVQPKIATLALVSVGLLYLSISQICKKKIRKNSEILAKKSVSVHKMLQEGLGGIREIIIEGNQQYFLRLFSQEFKTYYDACAEVQIVSLGPRYIVEMFGIIFIAFFSVKLVTDGAEGANFIPVLGALALCAQRLLPLIQQIYSSIVAIGAHRESVVDAIGLLEQKINIREPFGVDLKVIKNIIFKNVSFKYDCEEEWALKAINIEIKAGDKLGIVGLTGSGKSTLIDLLMGLLNPTSGFIEINNNKMNILNANQFQSRISHVPQSIYLKDATILENIAFSENQSKIDVDRAMKCIEAAQLHEMIKSIPLGLNTTVGERGIKFSGGELQRIGIARALYKNSSVIVLDEATSALDEETEGLIINSIKEIFVGGIIIMISHRPKSLTMCNKIIQIKEHSAIMIKNE